VVNREAALLELLSYLRSRDYQFTCVSPGTHARVITRPLTAAPSLRDIFGWNRSFDREGLDDQLFELLCAAGCLDCDGDGFRSRVRVATIGDFLLLHSSFPTDGENDVFLGPDSYRFARYIAERLPQLRSGAQIIDMGTGSGIGGMLCKRVAPEARVTLVDVNPAALELAKINSRAAGLVVDLLQSGVVPTGCDLIVANPPYMADGTHRTYRDGGDLLGGELSRRWTQQAIQALHPGGTFLLYTGAAFVDGGSALLEAVSHLCAETGVNLLIDEIDPDIFGEELDEPAYRSVERIAAIGMRISKDCP
jgi:hypothetical protein